MAASIPKKPISGNVRRESASEGISAPETSPARSGQRLKAPVTAGHNRTRSVRSGTPLSARAAAPRREQVSGVVEADARGEAALALEELQKRLEEVEKQLELSRKQSDVLQSKLDDSVKESERLEQKVHECEEQLEMTASEKKDATRQLREMESIYETERSAILSEKEAMATREDEMQVVIQQLKDTLAQRSLGEDENRQPRQLANSSPLLDSSGFAPPSSVYRSDSRSNSKLILQKDKLIDSLRLELAEAQIKLVESENQGGGRLQELERLLMESRMANARLMEDNESYQLLLQERTLKGDLGQSDFSYMGSHSNQEALNALEGNAAASTLANELSDATAAEGDNERRLDAELKAVKEQNKALTLYINKIIGRLLQHDEFESILDQSDKPKAPADTNKELPEPPPPQQDKRASSGPSLLQRAKSIAAGPSWAKQRPTSMALASDSAASSAHSHPETAPRIPIGNLGRSASTRQPRPRSEQALGAASLVGQMYKGPDGSSSPKLTSTRHSQSAFGPPSLTGNPHGAARVSSGGSAASAAPGGVRSETSSLSGDSGGLLTPPSQSPPRSHSDKQTTFVGAKPRPLRLVQENQDVVKDNKRTSWYSGWTWGGKKEESQTSSASGSIPE